MFTLIAHGGPVVWIIIAAGAVAMFVFLERVFHLHRARIRAEDFLKGICNNLGRGNVTEAVTLCEETPGPVAHIVKMAILNRAESKEGIQEAIDNAGRTEIARMERRLVVLATVAQTAPLFGLLGTVLGLIDSLLVLQQQGSIVQSGDVAEGLLKALVATAAGLTVAIPCYIAFNFLVGRVEKIVLDMEHAASEILAFLVRAAAGGDTGGGPRP